MKKNMNSSGLTLIEVLIALIIIAVAFLALANTQIGNLKVTGDSQKSSVATQVANDVLENVTRDILRMKTLGDPLVSPPVQPTFYFPEYEKCGNEATTVECAPQPVTTLPSGYSYQVSITGLDETTPTDYRDEGLIQVAVTVSGPASAKVVSYVSCYSVYPSPNVNTPAPCRDPAGTPL